MLRQETENEPNKKNSFTPENRNNSHTKSQEPKTNKKQNSRKTSIVTILVIVIVICCVVTFVVLFFINNAGLLGDTGIFATTTPTYTPTATYTLTPTPTRTPTLTATPKLIPGIDLPIAVSGVEVQVTGARLQESYMIADKTWKATKPGEILIVVEGYVQTTNMDKTKSWSVEITDENDNLKSCAITITHTKDDHLEKEWICAVDKTSKNFIIIFPGGQKIDLSSFFN